MLIKGVSVPKILFIKGIFKKDCTSDDIFEKRILENSHVVEAEVDISSTEVIVNGESFTNYEKLPSIFTNIETWKKKSNLACWNCTLFFTTVPIFIPKVNKLRLLHKLFYNNNKMKELAYYPTPLNMTQYGGCLTITEFKHEISIYNAQDFT